VDAAEHHMRTSGAGQAPDLVAAQRISGVNADTDYIPGRHRGKVERIQRLIGDDRVAVLGWRGGG
jgi:hypothetical protein